MTEFVGLSAQIDRWDICSKIIVLMKQLNIVNMSHSYRVRFYWCPDTEKKHTRVEPVR